MTKQTGNKVEITKHNSDALCNHQHPYRRPVVATITVTLDGQTMKWEACNADVRHYTDQPVVDFDFQPLPVVVN